MTYAEKRIYRFTEGDRVYSIDTYIAPNDILNKTPYSAFTYYKSSEDECVSSTYNEFNLSVLDKHNYERITSLFYMNTMNTRTYNSEGLLTQEYISYCKYYIDEDEGETDQTYYTQIIDYEYDSNRRLKKRSGYFRGEETTKGKDVEEYGSYVDGGYLTETAISYNSLEPSNAFVSETTYDLWGNVLKQTDSTGLKYNMNLWGENLDDLYSFVAPNGNHTYYSYTNGKVTGVSKGTSKTNNITYTEGEVTELSCGTSSISFTYNDARLLSKVDIDGNSHYALGYNGSTTVVLVNAQNERFTVEANATHTYVKVSYGFDVELETYYSNGGQVLTENDKLSNEKVEYSYTALNNLQKYTVKVSGIEKYSANIAYTDNGSLYSVRQSGLTDISYGYAYEYGLKGKLNRIVAGGDTVYINYDKLGRYTGRRINCGGKDILKESIQYKQVNEIVKLGSETRNINRQSNLPSKLTYSSGDYIEYTYDDSGNITKVSKSNGNQVLYTYDSSDRLIREDNGEHGRSYFYTYDNNGNITKKETCMYNTGSDKVGTVTVVNYAYNGNKLTSFNGERCTYDYIGNPTTYRGNSTTWKDRQLHSYGNTTFGYDARGRRIRKGAQRYYYDYADRLIRDDNLYYFYDHIGVAGFRYNGTYYTYKRDIQNNVIAILDNNGNIVVQYRYDAWGNHTIFGSNVTLGNLNPFRYRSYFYDTETGLYYLKTRYYDPEVGRFLNMDSVDYADPEATDGLNLYVYCGNNPVNNRIISFMHNMSIYGMFGGAVNLGGLNGSIGSSIVENPVNNIYNSVVLVNSHIFSLNSNFAKLIGNISVSTTTQLNAPSLFYTFTNYGSAGNSSGFGIHLNDWLDWNIYVSDNIGIGRSMQITPWVVFGSNISIKDGVSMSLGVVNGDTTNEVSVSIGWGTIGGLAIAGGLAMSPIPGGRILGGLIALFSLIFA